MSETLNLSTSHMSGADLHAIAVYLKDQPSVQPSASSSSSAPAQSAMRAGARIYAEECSGCHTQNGKGIANMLPSLNGSPAVQQTDPMTLLRIVLRGARSVATPAAPTAPGMPSFGWILNDDQVAAVLTYYSEFMG